MRSKSLFLASLMVFLSLPMNGCGKEGGDKKPSAPALGEVAGAFATTAVQHRIPSNILLALAYKESGLNAEPSTTLYENSPAAKGPQRVETAVGLPFATLGLNAEAAGKIGIQLDAYGNWVQQRLSSQHLALTGTISKADDVYDWVWQLARMHHEDLDSAKNLQIIFSMELIEILNRGFIWQHPLTQERIELPPANPKLEIKSFSPPIQANLRLDTQTSEIFSVDYLQLTFASSNGVENHPKRILVTHCPFSLSTCLGNEFTPGDDIKLQAHYVVPPNDAILKNPIKLLQHKQPVSITTPLGQGQVLNDALLIMLVGDSGRYVNGQRLASNPSWYTKDQLKNLSKIVAGACSLMVKDDPSINLARCQTPGEGLQFVRTKADSPYRFGDIPDFDATIFNTFIRSPDELSAVTLDFGGAQKIFTSGTNIPLNIGFVNGTAKIEVQLLQRCPAGSTVWSPLQTQFIRNTDRRSLTVTLYDQGPNLNGQHFIRVLSFDAKGKLMGWVVDDFFLNSFDKEGVPGPSESQCS